MHQVAVVALLVLIAFTQVVAWGPLRGMSHWADEQYTLMAAGTLVACGAILWLFRSSPEARA